MAKRSLSRMAVVLSTARNPSLDMESANNATNVISRPKASATSSSISVKPRWRPLGELQALFFIPDSLP
ncbi:hypothetical protein D9M69_529950 [compost metagenome]